MPELLDGRMEKAIGLAYSSTVGSWLQYYRGTRFVLNGYPILLWLAKNDLWCSLLVRIRAVPNRFGFWIWFWFLEKRKFESAMNEMMRWAGG
jgi:hypothetical protein